MRTLERRIESLESQRRDQNPAAPMTIHDTLALVAPDYSGPMPSDAELQLMIYAWLTKPGPAELQATDGYSAQERYMRMLNGEITGLAHGNA